MTDDNTKRDAQIWADRKTGLSWTDLSFKYKLATSTIRRICEREELKELRKLVKEQSED